MDFYFIQMRFDIIGILEDYSTYWQKRPLVFKRRRRKICHEFQYFAMTKFIQRIVRHRKVKIKSNKIKKFAKKAKKEKREEYEKNKQKPAGDNFLSSYDY